MFEGFTEFDLEVAETTIHGRRGGSGPPLLLLHGIPETHVMWHRVAPGLALNFTVVATDLRGYGDSGKPESAADHAPYAMRSLARDQVEVMMPEMTRRYTKGLGRHLQDCVVGGEQWRTTRSPGKMMLQGAYPVFRAR